MPPQDTKRLNAYVTPEAHDGWKAFAAKHQLDVSNVLEAVGRRLHDGRPVSLDDETLVAEAQAINYELHHRPRPRARRLPK